VLHYGRVPRFDEARWDFRLFGEVNQDLVLDFEEFSALPRVRLIEDIDCVPGQSMLDTVRAGVPASRLLKRQSHLQWRSMR